MFERTAYSWLQKYAPTGGLLLSLSNTPFFLTKDELGFDASVDKHSKEILEKSFWNLGPIFSRTEILKKLGFTTTIISDFLVDDGDRIVNSNLPLEWTASDLVDKFDVVLDMGVSEASFNIGQVFKNVLTACRPGGIIIHSQVMNGVNYGFWAVSPSAPIDFYTENNCTILEMGTLSGNTYPLTYIPLLTDTSSLAKIVKPLALLKYSCVLLYVVQKGYQTKHSKWPIFNGHAKLQRTKIKFVEVDK